MAKYTFDLAVVPPSLSAGASGSWFRVSGAYLPGTVHLRVGIGVNGQYVCTGLLVENPEGSISTTALRGIPISTVLEDLMDEFGSYNPDPVLGGMVKLTRDAQDRGEPVEVMVIPGTPVTSMSRARRGGKGPDRTELETFAAVYKRMLNTPSERKRPIAATARELHISAGSAHRWRALCEQKGLLES